MTVTVGYFVGSLAKASINRKLARALERLAPEGLELVEIDYSALPHYNYEHDADYPAAATKLKDDIEGADAILFVTPEYNRSIPGPLKNAIDWASRPRGTNSFAGKPAATIGASVGPLSTAVGQQHLKSILLYLNTSLMAQPEGYIAFRDGLITDSGEVTNEGTAAFLRSFMTAFEEHIHVNVGSVSV